MNIRKIRFKVLFILTIILVSTILYGLYQHIKVNQLISNFIKDSQEEISVSILFPNGEIENRMYHPIKREKDYELDDKRSVFYTTKEEPFIGQKGDIFVTQASPFPYVFGFHQAMSFFVGGHAALNNGENQFIEATGFPQKNESIIDIIKDSSDGTHSFSVGVRKSSTNYWMLPDYRNENDPSYPYYGAYYREKFVVLRVKNVDEDILNQTLSYANRHLENRSLYNFLFFI